MKRNREVQSEEGRTGLNRVLVNWLSPDSWPRWLAYVFAVALVLATLLFLLTIGEPFFQRPLLIIFVLPILLSAYLGGLGPGLVATVAAALGISYLLIPPTYSLAIEKSTDFIHLTVLILAGVLISVLSEFLHHLRRRVETARLLQAVTLASIGDAVITTDNRGLITFLNFEAERLTGWSHEEALGHPLPTVFRIINEQTRENMADPVARVLASGQVMGPANNTLLLARDGREIAIDDNAAPIKAPDGAILGVVLVFNDCTAKRQAAAKLRESEEHYRSLFENMQDAFAYCQMHFEDQRPVDFTYLSVNRAFETLTGLRDVVGKKISEVIPGIRESDPGILEISGRVAATGTPEQSEIFVETLRMWISFSLYCPRPGFFVAVFDVITERKQAEEATRVSLRFLEAVQRHTEISPLLEEFVAIIKDYTGCEAVGIRVLDEAGNIPYQAYEGFNSRFYEMESPLSLHTDQCMCINVIRGDTDPQLPFYTAGGSFYMNGTSRFLATVPAADKGSTRNACNQVGYESVALIPFRRDRRILGLIHVADSRENMAPLSVVQLLENAGMQLGTAFLKLQAEAALKTSEELYRSLFDNMLNGLVYAKMLYENGNPVDFIHLSANRSFETLTGLTGVEGKKASEVMPGLREANPEFFAIHGRVALTGKPESFEMFVNGLEKWVAATVYSPQKEYFIALFDDITERKRAEEASAVSRSKLETALASMTDAVFISDAAGRYIDFNEAFATFHKFKNKDEYAKSFIEATAKLDVLLPDGTLAPLEQWAVPRALRGETATNVEYTLRRKDTGETWVGSYNFAPMRDQDGVIIGAVIAARDITERKLAEEALRHSLAEKTALLREVHHRVKNNLQIVVSLLSLQASRTPHPEVVRVLEDTRKRVHSMALLHEALYRSDSLARINFAAYVEDLCRHLRRSMGTATGHVEVESRICPLGLPLEQSIPCGLIINELVSNAFKHAFPGNRPGKVTVSLGPANEDHLVLRVTDNGVGPPPVLDLVTTPTLGIRLVSGLASQLGGQLTVAQPDGAGLAFQVIFPTPADTVIEAQV